jgi:N-acylneuraminate cytidylyltransferase
VVGQAVAVVPARGGSNRIPRKNIASFNGKPMITWPLSAAENAGLFDRVVVSTDDDEIATIARQAGAEVPFTRPADLADQHAGTAPVIRHAITELNLADDDIVVCLYPTAAITPEILRDALRHAGSPPERFMVSVGRHRSPDERSLEARPHDLMALVHPEHLLTRTQDLPVRYFDAGKFYIAPASLWKSQETMMSEPFTPYFLPEWATVDIDEPEDWPLAEALHKAFVLDSKR